MSAASGELLIALAVLVPAATVLALVARRREGSSRRIVWVLIGIAGTPAFTMGVIFWFGVPLIAAAFALGVLISMNRRLDYLPAVIYTMGFVAAALYVASRVDVSRADRFGIVVFLVSAFMAMFCVTRVGRAAAATAWRAARRS